MGRFAVPPLVAGVSWIATWGELKANALTLGLKLTDADVNGVPLLATDAYGNVLLGPNGYAQVVVQTADGSTILVEGTAQGLDLNDSAALGGTVVRTGIAFIDDKNHNADPFDAQTGTLLAADADSQAGNQPQAGTYDNELLDAHFVAGDGRINENLGLTAVHDIFHSEHDRLVDQTKALVLAELAKGDTAFALEWVLPGADLSDGIQDNEWNGERLFQAAKFGTETQYQHLVFEEFARKVAPNVHLFANIDITLDPAITAEFANVVYRFGHSMLTETLNIDGDPAAEGFQDMSLIEAFTNPLGYLAQGPDAAGAIVTGTTGQIANEIDEFVAGALRNNLLGLPLDLAAINIARGRDTGVAPLNLVRNQIWSQIGDANLKPYANWAEFGQFLKHAASLVNFVAAYATHASIIGADTLEAKRAAALDLVVAGLDPASIGTDAWDFMHSLGAYANDTANPLAVQATWSTGSVTGLDTVDLWIGGLAEKQTLFGGLLGSTFQFIFETQLEKLQDGDRLYYLPRLEGTHFLDQIESNSFAQLIMANTGARHLPGDVFLTPEYTIEASTVTEDPATWLRNPETGALLVERLADGTIRFIGDDNVLGNTIVLGGTQGDDRLLAGHADDDTVWGDGGNDFIDGGDGADFLFGGDGDDLITDTEGDDTIHGDAGNDTLFAGRGDDTVFGGDGDDYIDLGPGGPIGIEAANAGLGNDIVVSGDGDDEILGNEGDDWIEGGVGFDLLVGDQAAPTGQIPLIAGNDVLIGGVSGDRMQGFSGDDIMVGEGGFDRFEGGLGFDWASFELEDHGVSIDMNLRVFVDPPDFLGDDAIRSRFVETEAASGTAFADFLRGTDAGAANPLGTAGFDTTNALANVNLIHGLADYFADGPVAFSDGNILFGGGGSDFIEGRGGNDIVDGDARLHVELTSRSAGAQIVREVRYDHVNAPEFDADLFAYTDAGDIDTAVFQDVSANYQIALATDPLTGELLFGTDGNPVLQVVHIPPAAGGGGGALVDDGTDTLYNIERLQFADVTIDNPFAQFVTDFVAQGALTLDNLNPNVGDTVSVVASAINDFEGILVGGVLDPLTAGFERIDIALEQLSLQWQYQEQAGVGGNPPQWVNIVGATGPAFTVTQFYDGVPLRVVATFTDGLGVHETLASAPTANVADGPGNLAPFIRPQEAVPGLPDTSAYEDTPLGTALRPGYYVPVLTVFNDDNTPPNQLLYTAALADGSPLEAAGLAFEIIPDANGLVAAARITGTPPQGFNGPIEIRITATDQAGLAVTNEFVINVLAVNDEPQIVSDAAASVEENTTAAMAVVAADPDASDTVVYSIVGGDDAASFTIDPVTGALSFRTAPDFEAPADADGDNVYDVIVVACDGALDDTQALLIAIVNVPGITLTGTAGANILTGTDEDDSLDGGGGADILNGGDGHDMLVGGTGADILSGGNGDDTFIYLVGDGVDIFNGDAGFDLTSILGSAADDTIVAVWNGTAITGFASGSMSGIEAATIDLDGGTDTLSYSLSPAAVNVNLAAGVASGFASVAGIENVIGSAGNDLLAGDANANSLNGGAGDDTFLATTGDGNDAYNGAGGIDTYDLSATSAGAIVTNTSSASVETGTDALASIEYIIASQGDDIITFDAGNNVLDGQGGDDAISGGSGSDTVFGGLGNDTLRRRPFRSTFDHDAHVVIVQRITTVRVLSADNRGSSSPP